MRKIGRTIIAILVLAAGCGRRETPVETGIRKQILHRGNLSEPRELDPHAVTGVTEQNVLSALLEGLIVEDPKDLSPAPGVAEKWTVSDDGLTYRFLLRPEARWSNGDPVTARDFVFSFQRILSPRYGAPYADMFFCLKNGRAFHEGKVADFALVGARAMDDRTLVLTLEQPTPYFLSLVTHFAWYPVHPPTILRAGPADQFGTRWTQPETFVGNGPFVLKRWEPANRIVVEKSPTYWDREHVRLNGIVFYPIGDQKIEENAFRAGQLHVTGTVPLDRVPFYRTEHRELLHLNNYLGTYYFLLNVRRPPLNDPRVRRALALGVDRDQIVKYVTRAGEEPATRFTPNVFAGFQTRPGFVTDIAAARALLAEAGYPGGRGFPRLQFLYNTSDSNDRIAQAVQQMWKDALGIEIELLNMEYKVAVAQTQAGKYDIARANWIGDYMDPGTFLDMWVTGGGNNRTGWSNPAYDELIRKAAGCARAADRYGFFAQAEELLAHEVPIVPLYFFRSKALVHRSVRGWYPNILDHHPYKHVYLEAR